MTDADDVTVVFFDIFSPLQVPQVLSVDGILILCRVSVTRAAAVRIVAPSIRV